MLRKNRNKVRNR